MEDKYMTVDELAQYLGFEKQTIYNKIHNNQIPFHKIGLKAVRFKREEIDAWIEQQKERERSYLKKGDKYYLVSKSPAWDSQITSEEEFIKDVVRETKGSWKSERLPFEFDKEDLKTVKEILGRKLVYPCLIKNGVPVFEYTDSGTLQNYLTLLKIFKDTLNLDINFLLGLRKRLTENVKENFPMPDTDTKEGADEAYIGFSTEDIIYGLLAEFTDIVVYLEYGKRIWGNRYLPYVNRYFNKESFLTLYLHGFCYFAQHPFNKDPYVFILKDKTIDELTPEQIEMGLKEKIFTKEEVSKRIEKLEAEVKALKSVVKQNAKGGKHGSKD